MPEAYPLALVTGAAQRIGRALAVGLADRGYAIGLHYHRSNKMAGQTAAEIERLGVPVMILPADLRQPEAVKRMFHAIDGWDLRILVNCAAQMPSVDIMEADLEAWDDVMNLNLRAPWLCAREAARRMQPGGLIVNITDAAVGKIWQKKNLYLLSKTSLAELTRSLARLLAPRIRVNAIAPGLILPNEETSAEEWQRLVLRLPMQRQGETGELVSAMNYLLDNEYITGETLVVDGGYQLL